MKGLFMKYLYLLLLFSSGLATAMTCQMLHNRINNAYQHNDPSLLKPLQDYINMKDEKHGASIVHAFADRDEPHLLHFLIDHIPTLELHQLNNFGSNPLMVACCFGRNLLARILIKHSTPAIINIQNNNGDTALFLSLRTALTYPPFNNAAYEIAQLLLEAGADPQLFNKEQQSPWTLVNNTQYDKNYLITSLRKKMYKSG